jgi:hypothetical protein
MKLNHVMTEMFYKCERGSEMRMAAMSATTRQYQLTHVITISAERRRRTTTRFDFSTYKRALLKTWHHFTSSGSSVRSLGSVALSIPTLFFVEE